jgi:GNAT superfamily N-acetyltransferase
MTSPFYCRLATAADLKLMHEFLPEVIDAMQATGNYQWSDTYPTDVEFLNDIELKRLWVVAVRVESGQEEEVAGFVAITQDQSPEYVQCGWDITVDAIVAHRLCSNPRYRGQGVAQMMYAQCEVVARERGIKCLRVDTCSENVPMNSVIKKCGYKYVGQCSLGLTGKGEGHMFNCYERFLE